LNTALFGVSTTEVITLIVIKWAVPGRRRPKERVLSEGDAHNDCKNDEKERSFHERNFSENLKQGLYKLVFELD